MSSVGNLALPFGIGDAVPNGDLLDLEEEAFMCRNYAALDRLALDANLKILGLEGYSKLLDTYQCAYLKRAYSDKPTTYIAGGAGASASYVF